MASPDVRFREVQRFRQTVLWLILGLSLLLPLAIFGHAIYQQIILRQPWGNDPISDSMLIAITAAILLTDVGMALLFYSARLVTEVRTDGAFYRFFPFHRSFRRVPMARVRHVAATTYSPIGEYGGWGIRRGWPGTGRGKAYNISGNRGGLFEFTDGQTLLIGSQRPEEFARAIEQAMAEQIQTGARID